MSEEDRELRSLQSVSHFSTFTVEVNDEPKQKMEQKLDKADIHTIGTVLFVHFFAHSKQFQLLQNITQKLVWLDRWD